MHVAVSDSVILRKTTEQDLQFVLAVEGEAHQKRYVGSWDRARHMQALTDPGWLHLIVEAADSGAAVGYVLLGGVGSPHESLELKRIVIAAPSRGYGVATLRLIKKLAFEDLGAHRLWLDVKTFNRRAHALYKAEGFVEEGVMRECERHADGYDSAILMSMLRQEYQAR